MRVFVRLPSGLVPTFDLAESSTVGQLKAMIDESGQSELRPAEMRLLVRDEALRDERGLLEYTPEDCEKRYLHVLLRITARQLFDVFDDVRDAVRVHEATLLASTGGNLHDKDRSGDAADARTRRRRDRGADDDIALRRHHKQTTKTVTLDDGQPCGWNV